MTKQPITREEIKALIKDGCNFRKKQVKGYLYISARKRGKEKNLARYSDELWAMIGDVKRSLTKAKEESTQTQTWSRENEDPVYRVWNEIINNIIKNKFQKCLHLEADGFCHYWAILDLSESAKQLNQHQLEYFFKKIVHADEKASYWVLRQVASICDVCPGFIDGKMIDFIDSRLKEKKQA